MKKAGDAVAVLVSISLVAFMWNSNRRLTAIESAISQAWPPPAAPVHSTGEVDGYTGIEVGRRNAPVTIVQFTDYQCPFCRQFNEETLPELTRAYIEHGKVRLLVRDLPLSIHPSALVYAQAARCAADLTERPLDFQDSLYRLADGDPDSAIGLAANRVGIAVDQVEACIGARRHLNAIETDQADARRLGLTGTPSFIVGPTGPRINGVILKGALPMSRFALIVDSLLMDSPS